MTLTFFKVLQNINPGLFAGLGEYYRDWSDAVVMEDSLI